MKTIAGAITIGQSPRVDLVPEIIEMTGERIEFVEKGALDGLTSSEIEKLSPHRDKTTLVTRLKDGTQVKVNKDDIEEKVQEKIDQLEAEDVDLTVLLCSGSFEELNSKVPLVFPNGLLLGTLNALNLPNKLGFLVPSETQVRSAMEEFEGVGLSSVGFGASPYDRNSEIQQAAKKLAKEDLDIVALHCVGYSKKMKKEVSQITGKPVLLVRSILARFLNEITTQSQEIA